MAGFHFSPPPQSFFPRDACVNVKEAGIRPPFVEWDGHGDSALDSIHSENLHSHHLMANQGAVLPNSDKAGS